jgi:hypothetical protein
MAMTKPSRDLNRRTGPGGGATHLLFRERMYGLHCKGVTAIAAIPTNSIPHRQLNLRRFGVSNFGHPKDFPELRA